MVARLRFVHAMAHAPAVGIDFAQIAAWARGRVRNALATFLPVGKKIRFAPFFAGHFS
jgi:hypothetical protein